MRIAIITERINRHGGQERVVCEVAERLSRYHEVHLYCFSAEGVRGERLTVHPIWCPFNNSSLEGLWILLTSPFYLSLNRYHAVISQGGNSLVQNYTMLHTCHALRATRTAEVEWKYHPPNFLKRFLQWARARFFLLFEGRAVHRCRGGVMVVSQFLKNYAMKQHGLDDDEVFVVENGVDHNTFYPELSEKYRAVNRAQLGIAEDAFTILFVGGRWFDKGVPFLVEALGKMKDRDAHLVIVGKGDVQFFEKFAANCGVAGRVHMVPPSNQPENWYAMADCFGFPSDAEGFPLVIGEAASCGLPLVTTAVGGSEHLVDEGISGYIVSADASELADRFDRLSSDPELLQSMRKAVHAKSLLLSWERQTEAVMAVLESQMPQVMEQTVRQLDLILNDQEV